MLREKYLKKVFLSVFFLLTSQVDCRRLFDLEFVNFAWFPFEVNNAKKATTTTTTETPRHKQTQTLRLNVKKNDVYQEGSTEDDILYYKKSETLIFTCRLEPSSNDYNITLYHIRGGREFEKIVFKGDHFDYVISPEFIYDGTIVYCSVDGSIKSNSYTLKQEEADNYDDFEEIQYEDSIVHSCNDSEKYRNDTKIISINKENLNTSQGVQLNANDTGTAMYCYRLEKHWTNETNREYTMVHEGIVYNKRKYVYTPKTNEVRQTDGLPNLGVIGAGLGTIMILILTMIIFCIRRRRIRNDMPPPEPPNPDLELYSTPNQLIYADLALEDSRTSRTVIENSTPYAQIVGYLARKNNK